MSDPASRLRTALAALCSVLLPAALLIAPRACAQEIVQPLPSSGPSGATTSTTGEQAGFQSYLNGLRAKAAAMGIRSATMDSLFPTLSFNPRVIQLDQSQPGGSFDSPIPPFEPYRRKHVDAARIKGGQAAYRANRPKLMQIERDTGVPEAIMVAIFGHETNYGSYVGDFDLLRSLATLAYEGRRRSLFEPEFLAALKMLDQGVPRSRLVGSWAGATGYPQFLPSVYLRVARDGDGDGRADIWTSQADALASIANYFVDAGWRKGQPWGIAVTVPASLNRAAIANRTNPPRCPRVFERHSRWLTMAEWRALGVQPQGTARLNDGVLATLLEPDGPGRTAYLLTSNYQVILDYNCSNFYALSVGLLADAVDD
ncbi:lytic murein transglycosylase [Sphingobium jiangsuense]|uniref:Lytic murein transglycosylase n=1 Tax=Sphingobium jiangsuense TaxID=870476 RepID=A0A7W6BGD1_9SPHN|nr:lytic murein transglycosylase [Sphingobium jiangsuense]MBB3926403.1 lytic murein transglycosylase [Sphingobium jiangsuense]